MNTTGTVPVASCNALALDALTARMTSGLSRTSSCANRFKRLSLLAQRYSICRLLTGLPALFFHPLLESGGPHARLRVVLGNVHQRGNAPDLG